MQCSASTAVVKLFDWDRAGRDENLGRSVGAAAPGYQYHIIYYDTNGVARLAELMRSHYSHRNASWNLEKYCASLYDPIFVALMCRSLLIKPAYYLQLKVGLAWHTICDKIVTTKCYECFLATPNIRDMCIGLWVESLHKAWNWLSLQRAEHYNRWHYTYSTNHPLIHSTYKL